MKTAYRFYPLSEPPTNGLQIERSTKGVDRRERAIIAKDCFD